jgi:hypothetical protein
MLRAIAPLLLLLGLLASLPGAGGALAHESQATVEAVLDAAARTAEPREKSSDPTEEPAAALLRATRARVGVRRCAPVLPNAALPAHRQPAPFHARAPPSRNVPA